MEWLIKGRVKTTSIVGTPLSLQGWGGGGGQISRNTNNETLLGCYLEILGRWHLKKNGKNNVSKSSLSQHVVCFINAGGIHGALYGAWWCEPSDGVQK